MIAFGTSCNIMKSLWVSIMLSYIASCSRARPLPSGSVATHGWKNVLETNWSLGLFKTGAVQTRTVLQEYYKQNYIIGVMEKNNYIYIHNLYTHIIYTIHHIQPIMPCYTIFCHCLQCYTRLNTLLVCSKRFAVNRLT